MQIMLSDITRSCGHQANRAQGSPGECVRQYGYSQDEHSDDTGEESAHLEKCLLKVAHCASDNDRIECRVVQSHGRRGDALWLCRCGHRGSNNAATADCATSGGDCGGSREGERRVRENLALRVDHHHVHGDALLLIAHRIPALKGDGSTGILEVGEQGLRVAREARIDPPY